MGDAAISGGFILIARKILDSPVYQAMSGGQRAVLFELLLRANWKPTTVWVRGQAVRIERGQVLIAERTLAKRSKTSRGTVLRAIHLLLKNEVIAIHEPIQGVRVLSLCNFNYYQDLDNYLRSGSRSTTPPQTIHDPIRSEDRSEDIETTPPTPPEGGHSKVRVIGFRRRRREPQPDPGLSVGATGLARGGWSTERCSVCRGPLPTIDEDVGVCYPCREKHKAAPATKPGGAP